MGRPREHDQRTAEALVAAAERTVQDAGLDQLSVRGVAADVGTTTRAVYSLFGSKDGLIVALGARAYELLGAAVRDVPATDDPAADLVQAGLVFRRFALEHPSLFAIGVQRVAASAALWPQFRSAATTALAALHERVGRLAALGLLGDRSVAEAAFQFHALCEGLASMELRARGVLGDPERQWAQALGALVAGFAVEAPVGVETGGSG